MAGAATATATTASSSVSLPINPRVAFGAGCYWGTEKYIKKEYPHLASGAVGFMNPNIGSKPNPTYKEVCTGKTGYVEVYDMEMHADDANEEAFEKLVRHFFSFHDPTTMNHQGNDHGTQYASTIFYYDNKQKEIANKVAKELQSSMDSCAISIYDGPHITTAIIPATTFYAAHDEHQEYLEKNPHGYCNHRMRNPWKDIQTSRSGSGK